MTTMLKFASAAAALVVLFAVAQGALAAGPLVQTKQGPVQGVSLPGVDQFLGIPYAANTGGVNRFMAPQPRAPWTTPIDGALWGDGCIQYHHNPDVPKNLSEDCLNLNVWRPAGTNASSKLPVMIFWHGGSFAEGSNQGPFYLYDGQVIASKKQVIVMSANYRLGALGFLVTDKVKGNLGLLDQRASLTWIQQNVAAFGGDPTRVTIWGESAGAMSTGIHLVMEGSRGLFHQAIMESNVGGYRYRDLEHAQVYGTAFCQLLNCTTGTTTSSECDTSCLQKADLADIENAEKKSVGSIWSILGANWNHWLEAVLSFDPVVDGDLVPMDPIDALAAGHFDTSIPILMGTNTNEGTTFIYAALKEDIPTFVIQLAWDVIFGSKNAKIITEIYANKTPPAWNDGRDLMSEVITDFWFRCASQQFVSATVKNGTNAYFYRYDHVYSDSRIFIEFGIPAACLNRTCHAAELPFVFHNTVASLNASFTPEELVLTDAFIDYWTSFVINGDPNIGNEQKVTWPVWDPTVRENIRLDLNIDTETTAELCSQWDQVGYDH